jgi:hypothetical protein
MGQVNAVYSVGAVLSTEFSLTWTLTSYDSGFMDGLRELAVSRIWKSYDLIKAYDKLLISYTYR